MQFLKANTFFDKIESLANNKRSRSVDQGGDVVMDTILTERQNLRAQGLIDM